MDEVEHKLPKRMSLWDTLNDFREEAALIGQIIGIWNVVEYHCALFLAATLRCDNRTAEQLIYSIASSSARISLIQSTAISRFSSGESGNTLCIEVGTIARKTETFLKKRNQLAHGLYGNDSGRLYLIKVRDGFFDDKKRHLISSSSLRNTLEEGRSLFPAWCDLTVKADRFHHHRE